MQLRAHLLDPLATPERSNAGYEDDDSDFRSSKSRTPEAERKEMYVACRRMVIPEPLNPLLAERFRQHFSLMY